MKTIECLKCSKKLRIPLNKNITFVCPSCNTKMFSDIKGNLSLLKDKNIIPQKVVFRCFECDKQLSVPIDKKIKFKCPSTRCNHSISGTQYSNQYYGSFSKSGLFSGIYKHYFFYSENGDSDICVCETNYKDGKLELFKEYYENGNIHIETNYKDGKLELFKEYYENGNIFEETNYKNGKRVGSKFYSKEGRTYELSYVDGSEYSGVKVFMYGSFYYYTNGVLTKKTRGQWEYRNYDKNGKKHGLCCEKLARKGRHGVILYSERYYVHGEEEDQVIRVFDEFGRAAD